MFNKNNLKYRYLVDSIELIKSKRSTSQIENFNPFAYFLEFNTINIGGVRQSGKTTSMKKAFRINTDIYISTRLRICEEFLSDSYNLAQKEPVFHWDENDLKIIKERNAVMSMNVNHLKERILITLKEDSIIFLDVYSTEIPDNYKHVKQIIDIIKELSDEKKIDATKIILIYT